MLAAAPAQYTQRRGLGMGVVSEIYDSINSKIFACVRDANITLCFGGIFTFSGKKSRIIVWLLKAEFARLVEAEKGNGDLDQMRLRPRWLIPAPPIGSRAVKFGTAPLSIRTENTKGIFVMDRFFIFSIFRHMTFLPQAPLKSGKILRFFGSTFMDETPDIPRK